MTQLANPTNPLTQQPLTDADLREVVALANRQFALEAEIATREEALKLKVQELNTLRLKTLPDAMSAIGLEKFSLKNGGEVTIAPFYNCSMNEATPADVALKEKALKWLRTNDFGALIKHEVKCTLGNDAVKLLASLRGFLNKKQITFKDGQGVHNGTLKAFMKEQIEAGKPFPMDLFKGFAGKKSEVTVPKTAETAVASK